MRSEIRHRRWWALALPVVDLGLLLGLALGAAPARANDQPAAAGDNFERRAQGAVKTRDVATLLGPFVDDACGGEMREIDRTRCRSTSTEQAIHPPGRGCGAITCKLAISAACRLEKAL